MLFDLDQAKSNSKCFWLKLFEINSADHSSNKYQLMLLKVSYHYYCSFQNVSLFYVVTYGRVNGGCPNFFCEQDLRLHDRCFANSLAIDLLLTWPVSLKSTSGRREQNKWGIRYFVICTKAAWCHRLEVLLFEI